MYFPLGGTSESDVEICADMTEEDEKAGSKLETQTKDAYITLAQSTAFDMDTPVDVEAVREEHGWNEFVRKDTHLICKFLGSVR